MKILAITQARYGSTRLPAKILKEVNGVTLLEIHLRRVLQSKLISKLKIATTTEDGSKFIVQIANKVGIEVYQGSIDDVLDRFYKAASPDKPDYVVRVTSDCPLIDPEVIDKVIGTCIKGGYDYVSNVLDLSYPDGMDVEIFKFSVLEKAWNEAVLKSDHEHVTPYIWRNSTLKGGNLFTSKNVYSDIDYSKERVTVDTIEDFEVIDNLITNLGSNRSYIDYISYLNLHKEIKAINRHYSRNEGYDKSLLND